MWVINYEIIPENCNLAEQYNCEQFDFVLVEERIALGITLQAKRFLVLTEISRIIDVTAANLGFALRNWGSEQ